MAIRKTLIRLLGALALMLVLWTLVVIIDTGGIDRGFDSDPDFAWARDMPGVTCEDTTVPVTLAPDSSRKYDLVGQVCWTGDLSGKTLQVLVSGGGYGIAYWDFPYQPDTYSYARAALRAGDAVFSFDRLGMGLSDHPLGVSLDVDTQAFVLHQTLTALESRHDFAAVVTLGHSFGSTVALAHALRFPEQSDGIVLTGFIHNVNPEFGPSAGRTIGFAPFTGPVAGDLFDPTYTITREGARRDLFYTIDNVDEGVLATDDATRETTALGELISMGRYFKDQSKELAVPVMVLVGEYDFVVCGGTLDCTDHAAVVDHETGFYPSATCPEVNVLDDTNHNTNLHRNAPEAFALMLDWVARRVGSAGAPPRQPCLAGSTDNSETPGDNS